MPNSFLLGATSGQHSRGAPRADARAQFSRRERKIVSNSDKTAQAVNEAAVASFRLADAHWRLCETFTVGFGEAFRLVAIRPTKANGYAMALASTILDGLPALLAVAKSPGRSHAGSIARAMLAAFIDLKLVLKDERYCDELDLRASVNEQRRTRLLADAYEKEGVVTMATQARMRSEAATQAANQLRDAGVRLRKMEQLIDEAGLELPITSGFHWLNGFAHNDMNALAQRHTRNGAFEFWAGPSDHQLASLLHAGGLFALCALSEFFTLMDYDANRKGRFAVALRTASQSVLAFGHLLPQPAERGATA